MLIACHICKGFTRLPITECGVCVADVEGDCLCIASIPPLTSVSPPVAELSSLTTLSPAPNAEASDTTNPYLGAIKSLGPTQTGWNGRGKSKRLPSELLIGGFRWRVKRILSFEDDEDGEGETNHIKREIVIRDDLPLEYAWVVLLHEIMHAVDQMTQDDEDDDDTVEKYINRSDEMLYACLRDNFNFPRHKS